MARKFRRKRFSNVIDDGQWQSLLIDQVLVPKRGIRASGRIANTQWFQWKERIFASRTDPLLKMEKKFFQNFLSTRRIYHHYNILGYFVCFLWIIGTKLDPDTSRPIKKSKRKSKTLFQCFFTCIYDWMNFMAAKPSRASSYSQASIQGGGYSKCTGWDCGSSSLFGALSPLLYEHYT